MSFPAPLDAETIVYDFLKSKYATYRSGLDPNTLLPAENDILWGEPRSELMQHSFMVVRDATRRQLPYLGQAKTNYTTVCVARFVTIFISGGKPSVLKYMEEFIDYTISKNQIDTYFKTRGISSVVPGSSRIVEIREAEQDIWSLNFEIYVNYFRAF